MDDLKVIAENKTEFKVAFDKTTNSGVVDGEKFSWDVAQINETTFQFSAKTEIDYINEKYKLSLPESEDYETLGGFVINIHESIPEKDEVILFKNYSLTINEVSENKIELITIEVSEN